MTSQDQGEFSFMEISNSAFWEEEEVLIWNSVRDFSTQKPTTILFQQAVNQAERIREKEQAEGLMLIREL